MTPVRLQDRTLFGQPVIGLVHLLVVYLIWGSTFLGIRVAVMDGSGWDPWSMAGSRLLVAGGILLLWARLTGQRVWPGRREWAPLLVYAGLIWLGGHGIVVWAEEDVPSGQAALIIGSQPIWGALLEALLDRRVPGSRLIIGLLLGFAGLVMLIDPAQLASGGVSPRLPVIILGTMSWTTGVVVQSRWQVGLHSLASSGWQHLLASVGFGVLFLTLAGGEMPSPSLHAWLAWGYLLVFGSLIAFTSYVAVLKLLPTPLVLTHAYVNPAVAVFLGWLVLDEAVTWGTVVGAGLILLGVAGVFQARQRWMPRVRG